MSSAPKGRAVIEVLLDSNKINKQLKAVEDNFKKVGANILKVGAGFTAFGAALIAPLVKATKNFLEFGDSIDKISARTGASAEFISALGFAAEQSGADIATLEKAIVGQQRTINDLNQGLATAADSYDVLGLSAKDLVGVGVEDSFTLIAQRLSEVKDPSLRAATALEIFGKAGQRLIPLLNGGEAAIKKYVEQANKAGLVINQQDATAAAELADSLNLARRAFRGLQLKIGASLAKQFTLVIDKIGEYIVSAQKFVDNNRGLIKSILQFGGILAGVGVALSALGISAIATGIAIGSLTTIVTAVTSALILAKTAAIAFFTSFAAPLTGVAILIGVIVNRIVDLKSLFKEVGTAVTNDFGKAIETAKGSFDALKQAVLAGDLKLAFKILTTSIELFFRQSFKSILGYWDGLVSDFLLGINFIKTAWQKFILNVDALFIGLEITGSKTVDTIISTFSEAASSLNIIFIQITTEIRALWLGIKALFKAGLRIGDGDISGARQVFEDLEKAKADIRKEADRAIEAELKLDFKGDSIKTENLKQLLAGNDALYQDVLKKSAEQEIKIISDLNEKTKAQDTKIDELITEISNLGTAAEAAKKSLNKTAKDNESSTLKNRDALKAIKSIGPQFGQLVETGSSSAIKLFSSNQNPIVKEQQKSNQILSTIAENTDGLTVI
ncbi:MAG: hypothetical protein GY777_19300 [Candidatus Brocadiaceae bacterium]|nr:hypothetical protein [Candidatus Brocadiaceae bacterium]